MSSEAIARVPMSDWLLALAVVVCGAAAIVAVWRGTGRLTRIEVVEEPGRPEGGTPPVVESPQGPHGEDIPELDDVDEMLWAMIEAEYRRSERRVGPAPVPLGALLRHRAALTPTTPARATAPTEQS